LWADAPIIVPSPFAVNDGSFVGAI
jgi:hypothetical protein